MYCKTWKVDHDTQVKKTIVGAKFTHLGKASHFYDFVEQGEHVYRLTTYNRYLLYWSPAGLKKLTQVSICTLQTNTSANINFIPILLMKLVQAGKKLSFFRLLSTHCGTGHRLCNATLPTLRTGSKWWLWTRNKRQT